MLHRFRKYKDSFFFGLIIIAIVAVMALYGINQMSQEDTRAGGAAAWVNGEAITNRDFQQVLENTIEDYRGRLGGQLDERLISQFQIPQNTLDEMVRYKLLAQQAARLGFRVTDAELADTIRKAPVFQKEGRFDPELYRRVPNRGLEEKRIRESMLIRRMQGYLAGRVQVPPEMLAREYLLRETKANLSFARIDLKALAGKPTPSRAELDALLKETKPEALKAYYDGHQRDFTTLAQVNLRQIRVGIPFQASGEKKAEAKKKMEAIAKQVTADNFEAMAKKHSDDEHAKKGGVVGWVNKGSLERAMEDAIGKLRPGEVSPPVETAFGYYLLQVKETRPETVKPLDAVKDEIAKAIWKEKHATEFVQKTRTEWEKKLASGKAIDAELKAAGIEVKKTGPFSVGQGYIPQIGQVDEIADAVFKLSKAKPVGPKLYPNGADYYYIKLESVEGPSSSGASVNREAVLNTVETSLQTTVLKKWIEDLRENSAIRIEAKFEPVQASNSFGQ